MFNTASVQAPIQCVVCLEDVSDGLGHDAKGVIHLFHEACLRRTVEESSAHCPLCREKITHIKDVPVPEKRVSADGLEHRSSTLEKSYTISVYCALLFSLAYMGYTGNWPSI